MALSDLVLDTSAYSAFKRGHPFVVDIIRRKERILIPAVVLGELLSGFELGSQKEKNRRDLLAFRLSSRVSVIQIGEETAERYAHIYGHLRRTGRPIPTNDLWIAASTMEHSAELLTADHHFENTPQIITTWIPEKGSQ